MGTEESDVDGHWEWLRGRGSGRFEGKSDTVLRELVGLDNSL